MPKLFILNDADQQIVRKCKLFNKQFRIIFRDGLLNGLVCIERGVEDSLKNVVFNNEWVDNYP